jgi:hypothetical protein
MGTVCLTLHWTPEQFWNATMHEIVAIVEAREQHANP